MLLRPASGGYYHNANLPGSLLHKIATLLLTICAVVLSIGWANIAVSAEKRSVPNIVLILADDLGYGDVGCYGQKHIQTPNIDRLAEQGTRFTDAYAGASVCAPSRCVLMTGKHLGHARVRGNAASAGGVGREGRVPLEPEDLTVAEVLKQAGYVTGITGKWGLGEPDTAGIPNRQGFDEWFGYLNQKHAHDYYPEYLWRNQEKVTLEGNLNGQQKQYSHDLCAEFAFDFVRRHGQDRFFLYLAWTLPHGKYMIPSVEPYADKDWPDDYKVHAAMCTRLDRHVGHLMDLLKQLGLDEKTIVFFCSDNGAVQRRDGVLDSAGPWRGTKGTSYEGGLRTPMIVRWPGRVPAGRVDATPWSFADFLPTAAELAGLPPPAGIDGTSVLPTLLGKPQELKDRMLYWEQYSGGYQQAVRWGRWKAIHFAKKKSQAENELYDLAADPAETKNLASERPEVLEKMLQFMRSAHTDSPYWPTTSAQKKPE